MALGIMSRKGCSDFSFQSKNDSPTRRVGESTRLPIDTIVFKPLNKSTLYVDSTLRPWLLFCQIDLLKDWFICLK